MKRTFDITVSLFGLIALLPLIAGLALWVRFSSRGPIIYRGLRAGRWGRPFLVMKFRSMVVGAERVGGPSTAGDDPRVTRVGAFMRRYKLDELPQLFNVLLGQMSLVGPRPEVLSEVDLYTEEQRRILDLRPGITDWASIWNSDEGAVLACAADAHQVYKARIQPTKLRLQLKYLEEHSLRTDLRIICYTFLRLLRKDWMPMDLEPFGRP
ncbi:MAG: sugar transferase [Acidobacteriota bacterium]